MKYKWCFSIIAVIILVMATTGCYKYGGETDNLTADDIFEEDQGEEVEAEEETESPLSKILERKAAEEAEEEESEDEESQEEEMEEEIAEEEEKDDNSIPKKIVKEGELVSFTNLEKTDADGDKITYTFTEPLDDDGEWQTEEGDAGEYIVTITASDGKTEVLQKVMIVVEGLNSKPVITINDVTVEEGETVKLKPKVTDADGDSLEIEYSGWMDSDTYKTTFDDVGVYTVTIKASDGKTTVSKDVIVTVEEKNRPPVLENIDDITVDEGDKVVIEAEAEDPDKDLITYTYSEPVDDDGEWRTEEGDAGEYIITVTASDGELKDSQGVLITVVSSNMPPTLEIDDILVQLGDTVKLDPDAEDPEGEDVEITYSGWMTSDEKEADEAGEFEVIVTASDGDKETSKTITVTVNTPPQIIL